RTHATAARRHQRRRRHPKPIRQSCSRTRSCRLGLALCPRSQTRRHCQSRHPGRISSPLGPHYHLMGPPARVPPNPITITRVLAAHPSYFSTPFLFPQTPNPPTNKLPPPQNNPPTKNPLP